ncbi:hypothetical protein EMPS_07497 [Entomortierella parvispora]|uniref:Uncharacterized protein n=1 Tax=Entomortierella parvispora TaxID=205924 RepID=A0A9P3HEA4_9FUNG|nr:hypothetical protein EMPS_07497 [Entomortierella parvispora]
MYNRSNKPWTIITVDDLAIDFQRLQPKITKDQDTAITQSTSSEPEQAEPGQQPEYSIQDALPFILSHTAMSQAMNVPEITYLIRQELHGVDLKRCVLVHSSWWKCFAPYLWERVFIDSYPGTSDQGVIFRNGLAARSLTLSIYDEDVLQAMATTDTNQDLGHGLIAYVAERCRNVTTLDLKLYSSHLAMKMESAGRDPASTQRQEKGEDHQTPVLDALFQKLTHVTDLSLSIVHEDLDQSVVNSVRHLPQLRNLTLLGGLRGNASYMIKKNRRCHWPSLAGILQKSCPLIETLSVAWESPLATLAEKELQDQQQERGSEPLLTSLRAVDLSYCRFQDEHQLDNLFWASPNLRRFTLDMVSDPNAVLNHQLITMIKACPRLVSFQCLRPVLSDTPKEFNFYFLKSSDIQALSDLVLSGSSMNGFLWELIIQKKEGVDSDSYYCALPAIRTMEPSFLTNSVTSLTLKDISDMSPIWATLQVFPRLERLTLDGQGKWQSRWLYHNFESGTKLTDSLGLPEQKVRLLQSEVSMAPACAETLRFLDMSKLEFHNDEASGIFSKIVVQRMKRLKHLHLSTDHIRAAFLQKTWSYEPLTDKGKSRKLQTETETLGDILLEKVFVHFGAVEFLYIHHVDFGVQNTSGRLSRHEISALTRAMPNLRVLAYDSCVHIEDFPLEEFAWMTMMSMESLKLKLP